MIKLKQEFKVAMPQDRRCIILDYREIKHMVYKSINILLFLFYCLVFLLYFMIFYQIILVVESNLREARIQLGLLRSMGLKKSELENVILMEILASSISSYLIGYFASYVEVVIGMSLMRSGFEMPLDFSIYWTTLISMLFITVLVIYIGTKLSVKEISGKSIAEILKGK